MNIAMIPARMGSQRLIRKSLQSLGGLPLITRAVRRCKAADVFEQIWVNSDHPEFEKIASEEGVNFHRRPSHLASDTATSEQYVYEFLNSHRCEYLYQVHLIAPLLVPQEIAAFVSATVDTQCDVMLSCTLEQIECAFQDRPINFSFGKKTNSQDLIPVQRMTWCITAWRRRTYLAAYEDGRTATFAGRVCFHPVSRLAGLIIKTEEDLSMAEALLPLVADENS